MEVLVYFPVSKAPLSHKFSGPYTIKKCMNNNNYVVSTPDRRESSQLVHVNLLKKYLKPLPKPVALHCASDSNVTRCKDVTRSTKEHVNDDLSSLIPALVDNNSDILNQMSDYFQHL